MWNNKDNILGINSECAGIKLIKIDIKYKFKHNVDCVQYSKTQSQLSNIFLGLFCIILLQHMEK